MGYYYGYYGGYYKASKADVGVHDSSGKPTHERHRAGSNIASRPIQLEMNVEFAGSCDQATLIMGAVDADISALPGE